MFPMLGLALFVLVSSLVTNTSGRPFRPWLGPLGGSTFIRPDRRPVLCRGRRSRIGVLVAQAGLGVVHLGGDFVHCAWRLGGHAFGGCRGGIYLFLIFEMTCQISLTPRPSLAENGTAC